MLYVYIYIQFLDSIAFLYENQLGAYDWVTYIIDGERVHYCAAEIGIKVEKPLLVFGPRIVIFLNFLAKVFLNQYRVFIFL